MYAGKRVLCMYVYSILRLEKKFIFKRMYGCCRGPGFSF